MTPGQQEDRDLAGFILAVVLIFLGVALLIAAPQP